jgi:hypothetical protein
MAKQNNDTLAGELIRGGPRIAAFLGVSYRKFAYQAAAGQFGDAVIKTGPKEYTAVRSKLLALYGLAPKTSDAV